MSTHKSAAPLRRTPSSRPHTAGADDVPVTTSMELLPPEAACSPAVSCNFSKRPSSGCSNGRDTETPVVRLSSTKQVDTTTQQSSAVGMLLMQRPSNQASQQLSNGILSHHGSFNRNVSHRYSNNTATLDANNCDQSRGCAVRPCSADSTHSMLVAGVPGPLPSTTPGTMSRLWSPESCLHGMDDSANSRACTANQAPMVQPSEGFSPDGLYNPEHADYYKYLQSRPATQEGGDDHAFVMPDYSNLERQSMCSVGDLHQQESDLPPGTPHSVASGIMRGSGVFFTALRRSVGGNHQQLAEEDDGVVLCDETSMLSARSIPHTDAMSCYSQCNPMQEPSTAPPTTGQQASDSQTCTEEEEEERSSRTSQQDDPETADYLSCYDNGIECSARSVWDNPVQTPADTTPPTAEPSQASFMSLLHALYQDTDVGTADNNNPSDLQPDTSAVLAEGKTTTKAETVAESTSILEQQEEQSDDVGAEVLKATLDEVDKIDAEQQIRRQELSEYMAGLLQGKPSEDGSMLIELPRNYQVLVEQLLGAARKAEYSSLAGWLGPRRFEDLPINILPDSHEDPRVCEGLKLIKALDAKLAGKEAEMVIRARERDPEGWAAAEKVRLARQAAAVEEALRKERMRRMRAAQLARAFVNEDVRASTAMSVTSTRTAASTRTVGLQPDEEALVEAVLQRPDTEEIENPFELSGTAAVQPDDNESLRREAPVLTLAPLQLSNQLLQGESSATQLITAARQVAVTKVNDNQQQGSGQLTTDTANNQQVEHNAPQTQSAEQGSIEMPVVDLALGLAVHSRALLRAQQAAIAGMPLAAINAHLEQLSAGHSWTPDGILADFGTLRGISGAGIKDAQIQGQQLQNENVPLNLEQQVHVQNSPEQPSSKLSGPGSVVHTSPSNHERVVHVSKRRDYLREERESKELLAREAELDARIRAFKTSDPAATKLDRQQLAALVAECRVLAERAEAAASRPCSAPSQCSSKQPSSRPVSSGSEAVQRPRSNSKVAAISSATQRPVSAGHKASNQTSSQTQANKPSTPTMRSGKSLPSKASGRSKTCSQ